MTARLLKYTVEEAQADFEEANIPSNAAARARWLISDAARNGFSSTSFSISSSIAVKNAVIEILRAYGFTVNPYGSYDISVSWR